MTFTLLPAVDVAGGRAAGHVRSTGDVETNHPRDVALAWQAAGAEWIHLVDVDAAFGRGSNADLLARVIGELDIDVQLSGGIRDDDSLQWALSTGCARTSLSTGALDDPAWCARVIAAHGDRVAVSLDVRVEGQGEAAQHRLAARGGGVVAGDLWDAIERLDRNGCTRYVVTDVGRDGMLSGPNVNLYRTVCRATATPVIASGGISSIDDLIALSEVAAAGSNLEGAVVGKALSAGRFTLAAALDAMQGIDWRPTTGRPRASRSMR